MKEEWEYKELGDLVSVINGLWTGKKPPFVNVAVVRNTNFTKDCRLNMSDVAYLDVEEKQFKSRQLFPGDIIIEKSGGTEKQPVGRPVLFNLADGLYSFSNFTSTLRIINAEEITPLFLQKFLYAKYLQGATLKLQSKTTGIHNLDFKTYLKWQVPVPPLSVQESIVSELDTIHAVLDKKKEQLKELDNLAQSIFYDMFGDPITNEKGWDVKKLGEVSKLINGDRGVNYPSGKDFVSRGYPFINAGHLVEGKVDFSEMNYITEEKFNQLRAGKILSGDILFCLRGSLGKYAKVDFDKSGAIASSLVIMRCNAELQSDYLIAYLRSESIKTQICRANNGSSQPNLSAKSVAAFFLPRPPLSLQQDFAKKVEAIEAQKEAIKQSIREVEALLAQTMDKYFG